MVVVKVAETDPTVQFFPFHDFLFVNLETIFRFFVVFVA